MSLLFVCLVTLMFSSFIIAYLAPTQLDVHKAARTNKPELEPLQEPDGRTARRRQGGLRAGTV